MTTDFTVRFGIGVYAANADFDEDGCENIFEFFFGTDPTDPASYSAPTIETSPIGPDSRLRFTSPGNLLNIGGVSWRILISSDLQTFVDVDTIEGIFYLFGNLSVVVPLDSPVNGITDRKFMALELSEE